MISPVKLIVSAACITSIQGNPQHWPRDREMPRSRKVAMQVQFGPYRVGLPPRWEPRRFAHSLILFPTDERNFTMTLTRASLEPIRRAAFTATELARRLSRECGSPPIPEITGTTHIHYFFYGHPGKADKMHIVDDRFAYVLFFPHSVLLIRVDANVRLGRLAGQIAKEAALIVGRTVEAAPRPTGAGA